MIRIIFRFDDPSPVSKIHVEELIFEELFTRKIPLTCAVIPARIRGETRIIFTRERANHIVNWHKEGFMDIALHGYLHREARAIPEGRPSEFLGVPIQKQKSSIEAGRALLEDALQIHPTGFVPPWNRFDAATIDVLEELGFSYLSAGFSLPPRFSRNLHILPLTSRLSNIDNTIAQARRFEIFSPLVIIVMHHYDFDRDPDDPPTQIFSRQDFSELLDRLMSVPGIRFEKMDELSRSISLRSSSLWGHYLRILNRTPHSLRCHLPDTFMPTRALPGLPFY